ncbi:Rz1-like lysis system protein LysC [Serratia rubidaea]|uniref:Rz1-like lysis system protein LysC n=1 Tax=Serratia rubidaea TaxID=61652 RepID=UPI003D161722
MTTALSVLVLSLFLVSCAEPTLPPAVPLVLLPPESVFKICEQPQLASTWGDIGAHALALQTALPLCADQVSTLNQWREGIRTERHLR